MRSETPEALPKFQISLCTTNWMMGIPLQPYVCLPVHLQGLAEAVHLSWSLYNDIVDNDSDSDESSYIPSLIAPEDQSTDTSSEESGFVPQPRVHYNDSSLSIHSDSLPKLIERIGDKSSDDESSDDESSVDEYAPRAPLLEFLYLTCLKNQ